MSNLVSRASHHPHHPTSSTMSNLPHQQTPTMQGLPTPPPSIAYDVNEFRRFFTFGLSQLKHNNKFIINDLTTLASVYHHRMSSCIVKAIEQFILESISAPFSRVVGEANDPRAIYHAPLVLRTFDCYQEALE
ncbi:hypothetical protein H4Q26_003147 [Puccinia striiformis f. sp. tritici PST-130]|nr:hypothetical protein H4Q26_003147 [Puccinia striiformis f. sp. tritici PST-130]